MSAEIADSYDKMAELYASLNLTALEWDTNACRWLATFADLAAAHDGIVLDLGCGPGHIVDHLSKLGLRVVGSDLSPGQIAQAQAAFPAGDYRLGDLTALDVADASLGGVVSRYSLIHLPPTSLRAVFDEWLRALEPGAPALVSFFGSTTPEAHGTPFDHKVTTAYELFPATIADELRDAGFADIEIGILPPLEGGGRPFDQATLLARKPAP